MRKEVQDWLSQLEVEVAQIEAALATVVQRAMDLVGAVVLQVQMTMTRRPRVFVWAGLGLELVPVHRSVACVQGDLVQVLQASVERKWDLRELSKLVYQVEEAALVDREALEARGLSVVEGTAQLVQIAAVLQEPLEPQAGEGQHELVEPVNGSRWLVRLSWTGVVSVASAEREHH